MQVEPGLSSYADNPRAAAESLIGLLQKAEDAVPEKLHPLTPVRVGVSMLLYWFIYKSVMKRIIILKKN